MAVATQTFYANGTFNVPAGVTNVRVRPVYQTPQIVFGDTNHAYILDPFSNAWAWGVNANGANWGTNLGNGSSSPVQVVGGLKFLVCPNVTNNGSGFLALDQLGNLWSCGFSPTGINSNATTNSSPIKVVGGLRFSYLANNTLGGNNDGMYALDQAGNAWGCSFNANGQLGVGNVTAVSSPVKVLGGLTFQSISQCVAGFDGTVAIFAIDTSGNAWSWGSNSAGILGQNTSPATVHAISSPVQVVGGIKFQKIFGTSTGSGGGGSVIFGLDTSNNLWAWGNNTGNSSTMIGNGNNSTAAYSSPVQVVGGLKFSGDPGKQTVTGGNGVTTDFTLWIDTNGDMWGWGSNKQGNLGLGTNGNIVSSPTKVVGGIKWAAVASGFVFTPNDAYVCAIDTSGNLWTWGASTRGALGTSSTTAVSSPVKVVAGITWAPIIASTGGAVLASDINGTIWGWGYNLSGALGTNNATSVSSPVQVFQGLTIQLPAVNPNMTRPAIPFDVTPGAAIPIVMNGVNQTFNGVAVSNQCQKLIVEYEQ